ncbi:MAG: IS200/IS605 family element RNA-guided endonuclease TnpB [Bacilli bacterium]
MLVKKAFKFRLYPNQEQCERINKTIGCARFVANYVLGRQRQEEAVWSCVNELVQQGFLTENTYKSTYFNKIASIKSVAQLKQHHLWLKEVDAIALQAAVEDVADAYGRYYKKQNDKPKFKSKKNPVQSYTTKYTNGNIKVTDTHIQLPKLGLVRYAKSRDVQGVIKRATIRRTPSGTYFIALLTEVEVQPLPKTNVSVGIDMGLTQFATLSQGQSYENPKFFRSLEEKVSKAQRILSRREKGSANWHKQRVKVARLHARIVNGRVDYLQRISTAIVKNHDIIGMEDLKVKNMQKNPNLAKAISEVSWAEFRAMIAYKCAWYGKKLVLVNPKYTSQRCYACGHVAKQNRVSQASFVCQSCGHTDNADVNASKNIKALALAV